MNFDLIVMGSGSAGATVAHKCRSKGWSVAVIDSRPFGGTCALRGCVPKKVLVAASEAVDWVQRLEKKALNSKGISINWPKLMSFKKSFTDNYNKGITSGLEKAGIKTFKGSAKFVSKDSVKVGSNIIKGKYIVIATGAMPRPLKIKGEEYVINSTDFLNLKKLPKNIAFIGAGYISMEFAHIAARAGSKVTMLHRSSQPLSQFDFDLVKKLLEASRDAGIDVRLNTPVDSVDKKGKKFIIKSGKRKFPADLVVHGAGRIPEIYDLDLEKAGVKYDKGILVNEYLQSSNPRVYSGGDCANSGPPLTPVAAFEGEIIAENLLGGNKIKTNIDAVPSVLFSNPPLASVGITEDKAKEKGLKFDVKFADTSSWFTSRRIGLKHSAYKVIIERKTSKILGVHILGHNAEEVINIFALAMKNNLTTDNLKIPWGYPTSSSDISYML